MNDKKKNINSIVSVAVFVNAVFGAIYILLAMVTIIMQFRADNIMNGGRQSMSSAVDGWAVLFSLFWIFISPVMITIALVGIISGLASIKHAKRWFDGYNVSNFNGWFASVSMLLIGIAIIGAGPVLMCVGVMQCICSVISIYGMIACPVKAGSKKAGKIISMVVEEDLDNTKKKDLPPMLNADPGESPDLHDILEKK
ncbi:MAG: hypothetical protein K6F57_05435 [Candidatus Saccharibacteria bacterium]|nr:hypothetical protein [Candidatus Saccharibacteria bacterium]